VSTETTLQTIDWLNLQLNQILCRTDFIDEMIQEEEDGNILIFLEKKLKGLDKQCSDIGHKIDFELKQLSYLEEVP
jgi:hypothetical protein